jgi:Ca2+-binding RTX toxin-like protein
MSAQTEGFTITGSAFNDTLTGGSGNDTLTGGNGNDTITGGAGTDTVIYSLAWNYYTISLAGSTYTITHKNGGAQGTDTVTTVENFQFADGTFTTANLLAPVITSNGGGASAAISRAENGTSVTTVTATNPNPGGAALSYSISGGSDAGLFTINSSTGVLAFTSAPDYENPLDNGTNNVYDVQVRVTDGTHDDIQNISVTVTNVAEADVGNTIATAGTMTVGSSVLYDVGSSGDRDWYGVNLTGGVTYAIWARGTPTEAASSTDPRIYGVRNASNTVVSTGDDDGGVGYESLLYFTPGSTGTYYIDAGAYGTVTGQILLSVFVGGSTQNGGTGVDTLNGSANADYLIGNNGNDILYGNGGSDILEGGNNDDYLDGGSGADVLIGGAGADTFVISTTDASDSIVDFTSAQGDILDISNILVGWNSATDDIDDYLQFQTNGSNTIVRVDVDGLANGTNFVEIATLEGTTGLVVQTLYDNSQIIA